LFSAARLHFALVFGSGTESNDSNSHNHINHEKYAEQGAAHQRLSARVVATRGTGYTGSVTDAAFAASAPSPRTVLLPSAAVREPWVS
jgi:hypothetical protein